MNKNIVNKIFFLILTPVLIQAIVQRAPGQPLAKPGKKGAVKAEVSKYVVTIKKLGIVTPSYNIDIQPVGNSKDIMPIAKSISRNFIDVNNSQEPIELSTHEPVDVEEKISFGDWRD